MGGGGGGGGELDSWKSRGILMDKASVLLRELLQMSFIFFFFSFFSANFVSFSHFMYLPKLLADALLFLWMFVKTAFTHISHGFSTYNLVRCLHMLLLSCKHIVFFCWTQCCKRVCHWSNGNDVVPRNYPGMP